LFHFICGYAEKFHKPWKKRFDAAKEFVYRYSIVWALFFLMIGLILWVLTYYVGSSTILATLTVTIAILLAFFVSCIEGMVFYLGYSSLKLKKNEIQGKDKVVTRKNTYFMMFFVGSMTLLSYPLLSLAKAVSKLFV
jgi:hypothetical protein